MSEKESVTECQTAENVSSTYPSPAKSLGEPGITPLSPSISPKDSEQTASLHQSFVVVVAIDFGTTSSGYAYSFARDPECIHIMR
ncbi:hypothetical protein scyTo_0009706 [Scyliorhinus torazame]|uniref:Uncharacterized protein n=3 Tax=Scyliorhinus torazame TaxID=75743 RepID=A0A401NS86_SCYTO|nr:hypothetical protein [Scyliorhinus torazame]